MTNTTYTDGREVISYSTKETAVFVRAALKAAFPAVTFSVKIHIYAGGSSTSVRWTDGPTDAEVSRVLGKFTSKTFDGMDDSTHYHTQTQNGREVSFSGYIHTSRKVTPELMAMAEQRAAVLGMGGDLVWRVLSNLRGDGLRVLRIKAVN